MSGYRMSRVSKLRETKEFDVPMTVAEMEVLQAILWHVGGDPHVSSPRGKMDTLREKLDARLEDARHRDGRMIEVTGSVFLKAPR